MEIEESELFEITDYTNVTEWEKFISKVEDIITSLENSQLIENNSKDPHKIIFQKFELNITLFQPDIINVDNSQSSNNETNTIEIAESLITTENKPVLLDCENDIHWELVKWFGRRKFLVFSPSKSTSIYGQDQINQLISSLTMAAVNVKCRLPIIVKYGPRNWPLYIGCQFENDFKSKLHCATIKYTPKQCLHLSGIRRVFQEKLGKGYVFNDDVVVSAKYLYAIENCDHKNENYFKGMIGPAKKKMHFFQYMPVGFGKDPIKNFKVSVHWSKVPKHILTQSDYQSLPPSTANGWYISAGSENSYDGFLYKTLRKLLKSFLVAQKSDEILQEIKPQDIDAMHINEPLMKLTKYPISNHNLFRNQANVEKQTSFTGSNHTELLDNKVLKNILWFIFPDAQQNGIDSTRDPYCVNSNLDIPNYTKLLKKYPTANRNSLIHRLGVCLTNLLTHHKDGMKCFSYIWMEVVLEIRYRLENCIPLPSTRMGDDFKLFEKGTAENKDELFARMLTESMPHLGSSQLEQRLQLINYCILTRLRNQSLQQYDNSQATDSSDSDGAADQFFDCETDNENEIISGNMTKLVQEPRGRLRKCDDLKLMKNSDIPLYVPITQVLSVDVYSRSKQAKHDESSEFLENYHAASLVADMSAFKAANPGCVVEDFIRWYSPKDFIESEADSGSVETISGVKGKLSSRMLVADNTWLTSWKSAIPIPARLQKRLFDDTIASESALKWMQNLTSAEISSSLINNVLIDSLSALVECIDDQDPAELLQQIESAAGALMKLFDNIDIMDVTGSELEYYQSYDEIISHFQRIEYSLAVKKSLRHKFIREFSGSENDKVQIVSLLNRLMICNIEIKIPSQKFSTGGNECFFNRIMSMYKISNSIDNVETTQNVDQTFTTTNQKEYILSLNCSHPFPTSRKSNQRMYLCTNDEEFRISTNFCEDITYF